MHCYKPTKNTSARRPSLTDCSSPHRWSMPWAIAGLQLPHRLIQGPLAGFSCAPFRDTFSQFEPPAYAVSEMVSAFDVLHKHTPHGRYLARGAQEKILCYQISGNNPAIMAQAASQLETMGADLIDINCGCPKPKIRKKGAGSALLDTPEQLIDIVNAVRKAIACPLTVKVRLTEAQTDINLAKALADEGVDALIVHGRRWSDDYTVPCNLGAIAKIKHSIHIPVIANGDVDSTQSLEHTFSETGCDAVMISRASTGKPWLFQELLGKQPMSIDQKTQRLIFLTHLRQLVALEGEYQAVLQSKSLVKYYMNEKPHTDFFQRFYRLSSLREIEQILMS